MAKKESVELIARPEKSPDLPGEILYRAKLVNPATGEVVRVLGSRTYDEDEMTERGHEAIGAEVMSWAEKLRAKKEETS